MRRQATPTLNQRVQGSSPCAPTKVFNSYIGIFAALGHTGVTRLRNDGAAFNRRRLRRRASYAWERSVAVGAA